MRKKIIYKIIFSFTVLVEIVLSFSVNVFGQDNTMLSAVICPQNTTFEISKTELTNIMLGEKQRWPDGTKVRLALLKPGSKGAEKITISIVNMNDHEFSKYWLAMIFQGTASAPKYFESNQALINYVKSTIGAIAICDESVIGEERLLLIDGTSKF